jgi:peptidoglycan hydrolase-like protein with peptidoglycan-binding domain
VVAPRFLLALALVMLAAACGGAESSELSLDDEFPTTSAAAETEAPRAVDPTLRVRVAKGDSIAPGSSGGRVLDLQRALEVLGFDPGEQDGQYGPDTRRAIIAFQKQHKLGADGLVGPRTAKAINRELAAKAAAGAG